MNKCLACHHNLVFNLKRSSHHLYLCHKCGSISTKKIDETSSQYDEKYYLTYYASRDNEMYRECKHLIHDCKVSKGIKILDYGAGSGVLAQVLLDEGYEEVYMYDTSAHSQRYLQKRFPKSDKILTTTKGLKYKFQTIFITDVISHLDEVDQVVTELHSKLLDTGGCIIIRTPIYSKVLNLLLYTLSWTFRGKFDDILLFTSTRFCLFTLRGIQHLTNRHNLHIMEFKKKVQYPFNPGNTKIKKTVFSTFYFFCSLISKYNQAILIVRKK